ncbi:MAG: hypothetical protein PHV60_02550 [bacterium]|nr:hypothetical protein [bacterium]
MEDVKQKLMDLENQVSSIKDPELRKIAFSKLLEQGLGIVDTKKAVKQGQKVKGEKKSKSQSEYYSDTMIRDEVKSMNITGVQEGLPKFKQCKSKQDCYLWIIAYAKHLDIDGLNNHEIAYILTKKLVKSTKYSTVYGIRSRVKEGVVSEDPETGNWRITPDGEEYLKTLQEAGE